MNLRFVVCLMIGCVLLACDETASDSTQPKASPAETAQAQPRLNILILGNSLAAGYGLDPDSAFPQFLQDKIDEQDLAYNVVPAGVSGATTSEGLNRLGWLLKQPVDILILELGANDGLRGINPQLTRSNLQGMIDLARSKYPQIKIVLAGMKAPPNMGLTYTDEFEAIFGELAMSNGTALIPFLLEDVAAIPELNQPDGIHPTVEGHQIVAQNVWEIVAPLL